MTTAAGPQDEGGHTGAGDPQPPMPPLSQIFDEIATGVAVTDAAGHFLWANPAFCASVGYPLHELTTLDFWTITHPDDHAANQQLIERLRSGERDSVAFEKRYVTKHGDHVWARANVSVLRADDGTVRHLVATTEDISAQKAVEKQLEDNQALLRIAGAIGRVGGWAVHADGTLQWSDEMRRLLGFPPDATPSLEESLALYTPQSRREATEAVERGFNEGVPFDLELQIRTTSGELLWARAVGEPRRASDGSVGSLHGAFVDVTDRKRTERELQEANERLIRTLESITDAFFTVDAEWRFTYLNQRAQELLQRDAASLLGRNVWEEFPEARGTEVETVYRHAMRTQRTAVIDEYYYPPLELYLQVNAYPSEQGLAVYFHDITAQRQARIALQQREARLAELAALLDEAQDAIMVHDLDGQVSFWNRSATRMFGWSPEEAEGRTVVELLGLDRDTYRRAIEQLLDRGTWFGEVVQRAKDGHELTCETRWTLVRDDDGRPESVLQIDTDITERKRLEQQFLRAQRMESIGTLASGVAHDLNNALLPVLVASQLLPEEDLSPTAQELLVAAEAGAQHGIDLVRQLLSFARGVDGQRVAVGVADLIAEVQRIATDTFPKSITITTRIADDVSPVLGDPTQLRQVLINLCVNARDALADGGRITLSASNAEIEVLPPGDGADPRPGRYVTLSVQDDGPGMSEAVMSRIFDPFFTTKPQGKGTGLGLPTCTAIVDGHGGLIEVDSQLGVGTTFKVHLPVADADTAPAPPIPSTPVRGQGELVLVVDDEQLARDTIRMILDKYGYRVEVASDGDRGVELLDRLGGEVAAVVTDLMMPNTGGVETVRRMRERRPDLAVVAVTGAATTEVAEAAVEAGASRVLTKPFTAEAITAAIATALGSDAGR